MKKIANVFLSLSIILAIFTTLTCKNNVALGAAVGILPPAGEILYPPQGAAPIMGSFVMNGTARDDDGVESVKVEFKSLERGSFVKYFPATINYNSDGSVDWSLEVKNEPQGSNDEIKKYPLPDGEYTATLIITDKSGMTSGTSRDYKIDNTPPVLILKRPTTFITKGSTETGVIDLYGARFGIIAEAGECQNVDELQLKAFKPGETNYEIITRKYPGRVIDIPNLAEENDRLYKLQDVQKPIHAEIYLRDNARSYADGSTETGSGNESKWFYVDNEIYKNVLDKGYTSGDIADYFAGRDTPQTIKLRDDTDAKNTLFRERHFLRDKVSTFALDPNKSPGFTLYGYNIWKKTGGEGTIPTAIYKNNDKNGGLSLPIKLIHNRDKTPIFESNTSAKDLRNSNIKITLTRSKPDYSIEEQLTALYSYDKSKLEEPKVLFNFSTMQDSDMAKVQFEGKNLLVKCELPKDFEDGIYLLNVEGNDIKKNTFVAYDTDGTPTGGCYICKFLAPGSNLRINPDKLVDKFVNKNFECSVRVPEAASSNKNIEVKYNVYGYKSDSLSNKSVVDEQKSFGEGSFDQNNADKAQFTTNVKIDKILSDGQYCIRVKAYESGTEKDSVDIDLILDKTGPRVKQTSPDTKTVQSGKFQVIGTFDDGIYGAGLTQTPEDIKKVVRWGLVKNGQPVPRANEVQLDQWKTMEASMQTWRFEVDFSNTDIFVKFGGTNHKDFGKPDESTQSYYNIPIYILTEDKLGNKAVQNVSVLYNPDAWKPIVEVKAPAENETLGGTINFFGTAKIADILQSASVTDVEIQFSKKEEFTVDNCKIKDTEWMKNDTEKSGRSVTEYHGESGIVWKCPIDAIKLHDGQEKKDFWFRVRAKNGKHNESEGGTFGEWCKPIKITIDQSAPKIENIKLNDVGYYHSMWIKDGCKLTVALRDESGISNVEITGDLEKGATIYFSNLESKGWVKKISGSNVDNYTLEIPISLDNLTDTAKKEKKISIKIKITEANTSDNLSSERDIVLQFDTKNPCGGYGKDPVAYSRNFNSKTLTDSGIATKGTANLTRILIDNKDPNVNMERIVTSIDTNSNNITFDPPIDKPGQYSYIAYNPQNIVSDVNGYWSAYGVAGDDGSGVEKVTVNLIVGDKRMGPIECKNANDENGTLKMYSGSFYTWEAKFNLSQCPDGKAKLEYTVTDKSGNEFKNSYNDIEIRNKSLKLQSCDLNTKLLEMSETESITKFDGKEEFDPKKSKYTITNKDFVFKHLDGSSIKLDFGTTGNGIKMYTLACGTDEIHSLRELSNDTIQLTKSDLTNIENNKGNADTVEKTLVIKVWDKIVGYEQGTGEPNLVVNLTTNFGAVDNKAPSVVIRPFHWNGEDNNSIVIDKEAEEKKGHVEIGEIDSIGNDNSSVSGKVVIRGFAYDNIKINKITANVANTIITATRNGSPGASTWKEGSNNGSTLKVIEKESSYTGYYVEWKLEWDTEKTAVGLNKTIIVTANDDKHDSEKINSTANVFIGDAVNEVGVNEVTFDSKQDNAKVGQFILLKEDDVQYLRRISSIKHIKDTNDSKDKTVITFKDDSFKDNIIKAENVAKIKHAKIFGYADTYSIMTVNVVPFIKVIKTSLSDADEATAKGAFSRASTGEYSVRIGENIEVQGFNLAKGSVSVGGKKFDPEGLSGTILPTMVSGDVKVTVIEGSETVESINNKVDIKKPYNIEKNDINNDTLTVNRRLAVWQMKTIIDNNFMESPQFVMDKNSVYYMSYGSLAGTMSFCMMKNSTIGKEASEMAANNIIEQCFSKYHNTAIAYDESGYMYGLASNTDRAGGSTSFTIYARTQGTDAMDTSGNYSVGTNRRHLENNGNTGRGVYDVNRVAMPKIAVRGTSASANVAIIYQDKNNNDSPIKFRYGTIGSFADTFTGGVKDNVDQYGTGSDPTNSGSAAGYELVAKKDSTHSSGLYTAVALTSDNRAIVVWNDAKNGNLVYSYRDLTGAYTAPVNEASDTERHLKKNTNVETEPNGWQDNAVIIDKGASPRYIDIVLDDAGGLHIGYYASKFMGVKYAYLPSDSVNGEKKPTKDDFKIVSVDRYMNPGYFLKIGVRKEGSGQVPYLSYYHNGFSDSSRATRMAWLKKGISSKDDVKDGIDGDTTKFTGDWTVITVPATENIKQATICQGVPTGGDYQNKVVSAYFTDEKYEMAVLTKKLD